MKDRIVQELKDVDLSSYNWLTTPEITLRKRSLLRSIYSHIF